MLSDLFFERGMPDGLLMAFLSVIQLPSISINSVILLLQTIKTCTGKCKMKMVQFQFRFNSVRMDKQTDGRTEIRSDSGHETKFVEN